MGLDVNKEEYSIPLRQLQFPVRVGYAMTINKAQGQSVKHVGLDLQSGVFPHGQLYVALSRCTNPRNVKVVFRPGQKNNKTWNVVYTEVLRNVLEE
ncbi:hypothetical protein PAXINDRAFT_85751 [Paxillus involutus ATCC 200175]|uniref:DNA replication helicase domain-containing protein n=1 Tax=Paxillus involutus ATCC 200175 TaxID=664439 RepID=A0A0C9TIU6_PAXIN|nr:hypothetical protein PAXINDRAFT_85751 [Paxillus involutus ATCC 200175]